MFTPVSAATYELIRAVFATVYILWAVLWALVCFYYGRAAYASWVASGGSWKTALADILSPFWWAFRETACRWGLLRGERFCGLYVPNPYEPGNLLRFAIFLSSLTPIAFGLQFADLNRRDWGVFHLITTLIFAGTSILAAGGHLFLSHRSRPNSWRLLVIRSVTFLVIGPPLFYAFFHFFPGGLGSI